MTALQKTSLQDSGYIAAVRQWLGGSVSGHLGPYMYTEDNNDQRWKQGHSSESYYLGRDDASTFKLALAELTITAENVVDLGPGGEESIVAKTLPLLNAVKAERYYAVDLSPTLAEGAAQMTANRLSIDARPLVADFFEPLPYAKPSTLIALMGGTLGNIETQADLAAVKMRLQGIFTNYRQAVGEAGHLLISFDANENGDEVQACYKSEQFDALIHSCVDRAIDSTKFTYDIEWDVQTKRLALGLRSTTDQMIDYDGEQFAVEAGQFLSVLNSYRYSVSLVEDCAKAAGWAPAKKWSASGRSHYLLLNSI